MHKELKAKRERMLQMSNHVRLSDFSPSGKASVDKKKEEEDGKKERRVIKMIVLNGLFNFFLRSPDLLVWLQYNVIRNFLARGGYTWEHLSIVIPGFSNIIVDIGYFTYILTFSTNFFIFYKFNSKFEAAVIFFKTTK
jgi:hypothetical protein